MSKEEAREGIHLAAQHLATACSAAAEAGLPIHEVMTMASQALVGGGQSASSTS